MAAPRFAVMLRQASCCQARIAFLQALRYDNTLLHAHVARVPKSDRVCCMVGDE
jgi:hypothetical protein